MATYSHRNFINPMIEQTQSPSRDQGRQSDIASGSPTSFRFSGHQTFPLRIAWLPKAVVEINKGKDPLTNIDEGIISLGLGKNMVESLRCWIEAFQVASRAEHGWAFTPIGELIFSPSGGLDPYLEDHSTSWLLHWLICTNTNAPFFAWECLFNRWPSPEFSATSVLDVFRQESDKNPKSASDVTLRQHWEVFVHSYRPRRGRKAEDHLDCVLSVLGLIREVSERRTSEGKNETVYSFDMGMRISIPQQLFAFFIHDWWNRFFPDEQTIPMSEIVGGFHSPGRILKMQENEILRRVADIARKQPQAFQVTESTSLRQLQRLRKSNGRTDLRSAYKSPRFI